jgi:hypothetical protein
MLKITFKNRAEGRRFLNLSRKHPLFKMYFVGWDKRVMTFKFESEEQAAIIPDIIKAVLQELNIEYSVVE